MLCDKTFVFVLISLFFLPINSIRLVHEIPRKNHELKIEFDGKNRAQYSEAPEYRNGVHCQVVGTNGSNCDPFFIHVAMTLDSNYLRGSMAAVHSILKHALCPENVYFHFVASGSKSPGPAELARVVETTFPYLGFRVYPFDDRFVKDLISYSTREALEDPLNYARSYLADILDPCLTRVIYLDSDIIVVDDIRKLWSISLTGSRAIGAPVYCHANFTKYFTDGFWSDPHLPKLFDQKSQRQSQRACYFNTGVMVMDLVRWRGGGYRGKIEKWMEVQKSKRIYELGSLPPFLLVFGGEVEGVDHRWNQHGLGGDNVVRSCRSLHPGPVSLLHWSGKGKPWERLDVGAPCPVDSLWVPYDLFRHNGEWR